MRLTAVAFFLLTSADCLLAYLPFTYYEVQLGGLFPWLNAFVRIHPYLYCVVFGLLALTLKEDWSRRETRVATRALLALMAAAAIALLVHPVLSNLENNTTSLVWSMMSLVPLLGIGIIDWLARRHTLPWANTAADEQGRIFTALCLSAVYLAMVYALVFALHYLVTGAAPLRFKEWAMAATWSVLSHLLLFLTIFLAVSVLTGLASLFARPARAEFLLECAALAAGLALIIRSVIFSVISFSGLAAAFVAGLAAVSLVACGAGFAVRIYRPSDGTASTGLSVLLRPFRFLSAFAPPYSYVPLAVIAVIAYLLAVKTALFDWGYLFQELGVLLVWSLSFAVFFGIAGSMRRKPPLAGMFGGAAAVLVLYAGAVAVVSRRQPPAPATQASFRRLLDEYSDYDVSFRLARHALSPGHTFLFEAADAGFYSFLAQNTHIPRSVPVAPVHVNLVASLHPTTGARPNVFIFVIDSLRRDYLSPYNPRVNFTPSIAAFAADSVVMENAFTHYGGTGLSEPSIWTGSLLLHKQYISPFYPMNALQKLMRTDGYHMFVSKDEILHSIMAPSPAVTKLDEGQGPMNYDLCRTLSEIEGRLGAQRDSRPVFVYTQPQNIHISVIDREGRSVPKGERYPGFDAPYASRIRRMDTCFGGFIRFLRSSGLYDNSIVVLTSDHGDSLGERGRWGHAYTLFPEIVRVPLIVHLPASMRGLAVDRSAAAFLTDITPSLYYLLGHQPIERNPLYGRPLFTRTLQEQLPYMRQEYLVVSSYAPVYGIVSDNGRRLFIADGVNYKDYYFDLSTTPPATLAMTDSIRAKDETLIRDYVLDISRFYHFRGVD